MIKLSDRLSAVASFVKVGARICDVGTDHGYLPVYLLQNNIVSSAIAADINAGPLASAVKTAESCNLREKITFVLTDGLCGIDEKSVDTVVIAGMGGETMVKILSASLWATEKGRRLILQPQTKSEELLTYLRDKAALTDAKLCEDAGRLYQIFVFEGGGETTLTPEEIYIRNHDGLFIRYADTMLHRLNTAYAGIKTSDENSPLLYEIAEKADRFMKLKGEYENGNR